MRRLLERFRLDTTGAVTVDWVVLAAGVVALGCGAGSIVANGSKDLSESINTQLTSEHDQHNIDAE